MLLSALAALGGCVFAGGLLENDLYHLRRPHTWITTAPRLAACRYDALVLLVCFLLVLSCLGLAFYYERRQRVVQAQRLQALQAHIAADVSHDLRTPLTAIKGAATLLESNQTGDLQAQFVRMIGRNCDRLAAEIQDLLDLTGPSAES
ncbi:MAG TPA: histidine kinase dimerization/phospho-acceptor domain-containing protein [Oscillatoriaceae cyanobacterium]